MKKFVGVMVVVVIGVLAAAGIFVHLQLSGVLSGVPMSVRPGDDMPEFTLNDYEGNAHSLSQYKGKVAVLNFCSHKCPFSRGIDADFAALVNSYKGDDRVVFLGIDSHYDTSAADIKTFAQENSIPQPILRDPDNRYADAAGARVTPDIFVVDQEGRLAYRGAFDNRIAPEGSASTPYVAQAINALLSGGTVHPNHVPSWGCTIKRAQ